MRWGKKEEYKTRYDTIDQRLAEKRSGQREQINKKTAGEEGKVKEFAGQENGETDYKTKNGDGRMRKNNLRLKKKKKTQTDWGR